MMDINNNVVLVEWTDWVGESVCIECVKCVECGKANGYSMAMYTIAHMLDAFEIGISTRNLINI